jgi:amidase
VVVAANYAPASVGSETSGSILSPSSQQSVVGLKPTIGVLSQDGIVPISSTLDTPGPISKTIVDNSILFSAMLKSKSSGSGTPWQIEKSNSLQGVRFGAFKAYREDSLYQKALVDLENLGAEIIEIDPEPMRFDGFLNLLSGDMKIDLKQYLKSFTSEEISVTSASDVMAFNKEDSTLRIPYGQARFEGIDELDLTEAELMDIRDQLLRSGIDYFETPMQKYDLDAVLSINNYNAGQAAAAKYPALTVPMGYSEEGEPKGLTFIAKPYRETQMYTYAKHYEQASAHRKSPELYAIK